MGQSISDYSEEMLWDYIEYVEDTISKSILPVTFDRWHDCYYHYEKADNNE
jgi:hypothetical protein